MRRVRTVDGLLFEEVSITPSIVNRMDVACFVGFVSRRARVPLPTALSRWFETQGWRADGRGRYARPVDDLLDVPVPIEAWNTFDRLFAWELRPLSSDLGAPNGVTYLGAAVRSFFAQGGKKCYIIRVGDAWPFTPAPHITPEAYATSQQERLNKLIPGFSMGMLSCSPQDRDTWSGVGHLFGLEEVSFLCMPDLPDIVRPTVSLKQINDTPGPLVAEDFVDCSDGETAAPDDRVSRILRAPRCDSDGYDLWAAALNMAAMLVSRFARDIQIVASIPIPGTGPSHYVEAALVAADDVEANIFTFLSRSDGPLAKAVRDWQNGLASAFIQLTYPWLRTRFSAQMPEGLESPDGVLVGMLAYNAIARGTFRSAVAQPASGIQDIFPALSRHQMLTEADPSSDAPSAMIDHISLFGYLPGGLTLLSDVTTSPDDGYRSANVNRLVSVIARSARRIGEESVFEASGERLWETLRLRMNGLMGALFDAGAFDGPREEAYSVICDRSTMTQNDLDNGRAIVIVQFQVALPIEQITVVLAMNDVGQVSLLSGGGNG